MAPNPSKILEGQFILHETVGSGGFAKVKRATQLVTGERVAIKIMDKKALGDDLPRVASEVAALKELCHQNICRLYQVIESEEKIFLVLEHCAGGELFDYIVKKDRLPEPEARHFFRQIISAVAYVHSKGYAHRDLKPENLLLTEELQIKLIDFGLCAKPEHGLTWGLETCCGSPAYAAPELLSGSVYCGNEADIWSLGVLLYALLCGFLPFEDDNLQTMYKKIQTGSYDEPSWLSEGSKSILKIMLQTNPKRRAKIEDLLIHPWIVRDYSLPLKWRSIYEPAILDRDCLLEMAIYNDCTIAEITQQVEEWKYDETSCVYFLLLYKKRHNKPMILSPAPRKMCTELKASPRITIVRSPTIHGSLEFDLDTAGRDDRSATRNEPKRTTRSLLETPELIIHKVDSAQLKKISQHYQQKAANGADILTPVTKRIVTRPPDAKRKVHENGYKHNEDDTSATNIGARFASSLHRDEEIPNADVKNGRTPSNGSCAKLQPKGAVAVYATPAGTTFRKLPFTDDQMADPRDNNTPFASYFTRFVIDDMEREPMPPPLSDRVHDRTRSPRSKSKGPPLPRRVFNSVERQVDRVITALTPKRYRNGNGTSTPVKIRHSKTLVNVSTASSKSPEHVLNELLRIFEDKGIACKQRDWTIRGKAKDKDGRTTLTLELEVVYVDRLDMVGVRRKRLNGPSFMYKRICEDILSLAGL